MTTYTIGEVADATGFSTSALRYYEGIDLVVPAARTAGGFAASVPGSASAAR